MCVFVHVCVFYEYNTKVTSYFINKYHLNVLPKSIDFKQDPNTLKYKQMCYVCVCVCVCVTMVSS